MLWMAAAALLMGCASLDIGAPPAPPWDHPVRGFAPPQVLWRINLSDHGFFLRTNALEMSTPVLVEGQGAIVVGSSGGQVMRIGSSDGKVQWRSDLEGGVLAPLLISGNAFLVGCDDGRLSRLSAASGKLSWSYATKGVVRSRPLVLGGRVFFSSEEEKVYALDMETGKWLWEYHRPPSDDFTISGIASPLVASARIVAGFADGTVVALQPEDGTVVWSNHLAKKGIQFADVDLLLLPSEDLLLAASFAGGLYALNPEDGEVLWHAPEHRSITSLTASCEGLLAGTGEGRVLRLSLADGRLGWQRRFGGGAVHGILEHSGRLVVSSQDLGLLFLSAQDGRFLLRFDPGAGVSAGVLHAGARLFFLSNRGYLYSIGLS